MVQHQVMGHIEGNAVFSMTKRSDTVNTFLHLAVAPFAAFDGVRGRTRRFVIQKLQALLKCRRIQFREALRECLESLDMQSKLPQFFQRRLRSTPAIIQKINLIDDLTQLPQFRSATRNFTERFAIPGRQDFLSEQVMMIEQRTDRRYSDQTIFRLNASVFANRRLVFLRCYREELSRRFPTTKELSSYYDTIPPVEEILVDLRWQIAEKKEHRRKKKE